MADTVVNTSRAPSVNTDRLAFAPLTADTDSTLTYGDVVEISKASISVSRTPKMNSSKMYASGQVVASYVAKAGGQLQITMPSLDNSDEVLLFGKSYDATTKTVTNNKDDYVPAVMAIYSTDRADGTKNLYKVMKVKFAEGAENVETSDDSGTKFQSVQISGDYEQLIKNGDDVIVLRGVDPTTEDGKALISAWFGSALGGLPAGHYPTTPTNTEEQGG